MAKPTLDFGNPAIVRPLVPALRRISNVPGISVKRASFDLCCELAHLEGFLAHWKVSASGLTPQKLEQILRQVGLEDEDRRPAKSAPPSEPKSVAPTGLTYTRVVKFLVEHPDASENKACKATGVSQSSWAAFKQRHFGLGKVAPAKLAAFLDEQEGRVPSKPVIPLVTIAPGPAEVAKARDLPKPIEGTITDKERRHLVASLATGVLASPSGHTFTQNGVIVTAFELFDELMAQDLARATGKARK